MILFEVIKMALAKGITKEVQFTYSDYKKWNDSEDWEIIDGKAYNMAPSPIRIHQEIGEKLLRKIGNYLEDKPCKIYYDLDVVLSNEDIVKPDIFVVCDKNKLTEKNVQGAPDLVIEILSPSTALKDRNQKFNLYKNYGVREYWIVDPYYLIIEVYDFVNEEKYLYGYNEEDKENMMEVLIFNGELKLDVNYILGEEL